MKLLAAVDPTSSYLMRSRPSKQDLFVTQTEPLVSLVIFWRLRNTPCVEARLRACRTRRKRQKVLAALRGFIGRYRADSFAPSVQLDPRFRRGRARWEFPACS